MSFPEVDYVTTPIREADADAIVLALPPLDVGIGDCGTYRSPKKGC